MWSERKSMLRQLPPEIAPIFEGNWTIRSLQNLPKLRTCSLTLSTGVLVAWKASKKSRNCKEEISRISGNETIFQRYTRTCILKFYTLVRFQLELKLKPKFVGFVRVEKSNTYISERIYSRCVKDDVLVLLMEKEFFSS